MSIWRKSVKRDKYGCVEGPEGVAGARRPAAPKSPDPDGTVKRDLRDETDVSTVEEAFEAMLLLVLLVVVEAGGTEGQRRSHCCPTTSIIEI